MSFGAMNQNAVLTGTADGGSQSQDKAEVRFLHSHHFFPRSKAAINASRNPLIAGIVRGISTYAEAISNGSCRRK